MVVRPKTFLLLSILLILITRGAIIFTGHADDAGGIDLSIYREAGELVANGVNPYDFEAKPSLRGALRADRNGILPEIIPNKPDYDRYVSGNLPGSIAFYGLVEAIHPGSIWWWRSALALGDVLIAVAAAYFLSRAGILLDTTGKQVAFSLAVIWYPSLIYWGTILAEDKQYQTALMLLLAGLTIAPPKRPLAATLAIAVTGFLSVVFKALGVFLLPVAAKYFWARPLREAAIATLLAGLLTAVLLYYFGSAFVGLATRAMAGSSSLAISHGSPWRLLPVPIAEVLRPALCVVLIAAIAVSCYRGTIDLINASAAALVVFICLWIVSGSMDMLNIAMMFAMMSLATLSVTRWRQLVAINFAFQLPVYICVAARLREPQWFFGSEIPDAATAAVFVVSYFALLFLPRPDDGIAT